jgi:FMN phosphatase YigB (HAD superfamily)
VYDHLRPFPDAVPALRALAGLGYELAMLSNGTPAMIGNCLANSGGDHAFYHFGLRWLPIPA